MINLSRNTKIVIGSFLFFVLLVSGCTGKKSRRLVIVGFDGLTSDILIPMIEEGSLPHFSRMLNTGSSGNLTSSIPQLAPTAWTTATTGVNPGKHGIFSYCKGLVPVGENEFLVSYYSSADRGVSPLWVLLTDAGQRSIVINVPSTSPPDSINGMMVAGGPYTSTTDFTIPGELKEKFSAEFTLSGAEGSTGRERGQQYLDYLKTTFTTRKEAALELMDTEDWDVFFVVFTIPDRVQRYFWQYADKEHPLYTDDGASLFGETIADVYREIDRTIGEFDTRTGSMGANFLTFSASGHEPVYRTVNGSNLIKEHWPMEGRDIYIGQADKHRGIFSIWFSQPPEVNKENWEKYSALNNELVQTLGNLRDPETGETVTDSVYQRANIYSGPRSNRAPDIIAAEERGYLFVNRNYTQDGKIIELPEAGTFCSHPGTDGVLFARGPDIEAGVRLNNAGIMDIVPTVLYLKGVSVASYMDGRVLEEMISGEYTKKHPLDDVIRELPMEPARAVTKLTVEEENQLRVQLDPME